MNFWQKVELGIVFIFLIEGANLCPYMVSFPGESAMGLGRVGASVQGRGEGRGLGRGSGGFAGREKEGRREILYQGVSRKN